MLDAPLQLAALQPTRAPDFIIGTPDRPYLLRWWLIPRNDQFNVYYHRFLRDDDDRALHDHPWPSFSVMTSGRLREVTAEGSRIVNVGDCIYRGPEFSHRLELIDGEPTETLFITGPRVREWGFHCPKGWVHWRDFVGDNEERSGAAAES
ncbi:cupin domain-containing protein [Seohaeicola zhoushanensis]